MSKESDCDIWTKLGTLIVFLMASFLPPWLSFSLTATCCLSLSTSRMVSTADTPLLYLSMNVSPSPASSSCPEAAATARLSRSSSSAEALGTLDTIS